MANGDGEYILFGVKDQKIRVATPEVRSIIGIPHTSDLRKGFGDKLELVQRDIYFDVRAVNIPGDSTKCVLVVHVPTSPLRPHIDVREGKFYIRGEGGSAKAMDFFQVRDQMLYTEGRLRKVTLLRLELATFIDVCNMLMEPSTWSVHFDASAFKVLLADICDMLQPDSDLLALLHGIGSGTVALNYLLDRQGELRLQPPVVLGGEIEQNVVTQQVIKRQGQLFNNCGEAQARLEALFGPLKTS
jgi:hypothetical protein